MTQRQQSRELNTAFSAQPKLAALGTAPFTTIVTAAGGGETRYGPIAVTRWRNDATLDDHGQWCYVRDVTNGRTWSAAYQPVCSEPDSYRVRFEDGIVSFDRKDGDIETKLEITVSPETASELRRVTLLNHSATTREIELTSYSEIVIAPPAADRGHPAFANLFV